MDLSCIKALINAISAIAALAAAILWYKSSVVIIRPTEQRDQEGWTSAQITVQSDSMGDFDPFLTGIEQSLWNKRAATAAAFAALFQAIGLLIPEPS